VGDVVFRGLDALLRELQVLLDRPRALRHDRKPYDSERTRWHRSRERALPILCLIGDQVDSWVQALDDRLGKAARPTVLYASLDLDQTAAPDPDDGLEPRLLPLLEVLRERLAHTPSGHRHRLRFRAFRLVDLLTRLPVRSSRTRDERSGTTAVLRSWHRATATDAEPVKVTALGAVEFSPGAVVRALRYRWWSWFGRERSWLVDQQFAAPRHFGSFVGFAEWLAGPSPRQEAREEVKRLLVHAFLQELRWAYGMGSWRFRRGRRTAYALVVLKGVTEENGGWELLRLVNDVRNQSTEPDPLLVVATADAAPRWLVGDDRVEPVYRLSREVGRWASLLPERRQSMHRTARFVVSRMPEDDDGPASDQDEAAWTDVGHPRPKPVPLLIRRVTTRLACLVLVASLLVPAGFWVVPRWVGDCLPGTGIGVSTRLVDSGGRAECVGYSDRAGQVFGTDERLLAAQRAVFELNETALRLHAEATTRPLVSVVYLSEFTKPDGQLGADDSTTEQLTGLLLLQAEMNRRSDHSTPLLRVVLANAGFEMRHARSLVDLLAPLLAEDPTILGAVGMSRTVEPVEQAITALGDLGVPVIATTLTGVGLTDRSPLYFQVVPDNRREAALVKLHADKEGKKLTVYQPDEVRGDGYLTSLGAEMAKLVDPAAFTRWTDVGTVVPVCGADQIAFYAGRQVDFDRFFDRVLDECGTDPPVVIGDDTVARFVAQREKRAKARYSGKSILYVSLGPMTVLNNRSCLPDDGRPATSLCLGLRDLLDGADVYGPAGRAFGEILRAQPPVWIGERVGLSYDGAGVFLQAAAAVHAAGSGPHRSAVAQELRESACSDPVVTTRNCYEGASGRIDLSRFRDGRDRPLALLRLPDVRDVTRPPDCVLLLNADQFPCP